jgi:hypothetical protein
VAPEAGLVDGDDHRGRGGGLARRQRLIGVEGGQGQPAEGGEAGRDEGGEEEDEEGESEGPAAAAA